MIRTSVRVLPRLAAIAVGLVFALLTGELVVRRHIERTQFSNSLAAVAEYRRRGEEDGDAGLAALIRLSPNPRLFYELMPGLDVRFHGTRVLTNSAGMREDRDYDLERAPGTVRIVGIGDSGMFGWEVEQGEDYLSLLEERLNVRSDGSFEVLNLAVPGYNTQLELESLLQKGLAYDPNAVVVGWCKNDIELPNFLLEKEELRSDVSYLYRLLFERERYEASLGTHMASPRTRELPVPELLREGLGPAGVERMLVRLNQLSEERGFKLLVFGPLGPPARRVLERIGVDYCSTLEAIPGDSCPEEWRVWDIHPSAEGHRVLGEFLAAEVERRGWLELR